LVVVAFAGVLIDRALSPARAVQAQRFSGQVMHDALGLFSATTPPGWKMTGGRVYGEYTGTNTTGPTPVITEVYYFQDQQPGETSAMVRINVTAFKGKPNPDCSSNYFTDTKVDGLPAKTNVPGYHQAWEFFSGNASFDVSFNNPTLPAYGSVIGGEGTPIPAVTDPASAQTQALAILKSIQVTDRHISCH
jgi:hypothetical protein